MNYILFDGPERNQLLPFTFTRPVACIRVGIFTIMEKWEMMMNEKFSFHTEQYLREKFNLIEADENICINGAVLPNADLIKQINELEDNERLIYNDTVIAFYCNHTELLDRKLNYDDKLDIAYEGVAPIVINYPWDIFTLNDIALRNDYEVITKGRESKHIYAPNQLIGIENIFIEEGAKVTASVLNASTGPIYIGRDSEVMDGSMIRGPFALCEHATIKMGAKIYGPTTIGPYCKVGGEINNAVFFGYSNKAHDGFIGNSVIGEWCNIGADTNNSNLKNNYSNVKAWSFVKKQMIDTGLQFCGLFMGDHTKCSINTMFNTGTVTGVCANIFGGDFPPKYIPSFGWGGSHGFDRFMIERAVELAEIVYERRGLVFDVVERKILQHLFNHEK